MKITRPSQYPGEGKYVATIVNDVLLLNRAVQRDFTCGSIEALLQDLCEHYRALEQEQEQDLNLMTSLKPKAEVNENLPATTKETISLMRQQGQQLENYVTNNAAYSRFVARMFFPQLKTFCDLYNHLKKQQAISREIF